MLDPGDFDTLMSMQQRGPGQDAAGQPVVAPWIEVARVWADLRQQRGLEAIRAGAVTATVSSSVRIHWQPGVTSDMRLVDVETGDVYQITSVLKAKAHEYIDVVCEVTT
ncbi:MAG: head-tail adaptor protein [Comamonadaceae bacterium]|nr:MAG: head-tail adaptor protein [Comamonadaceae bacterium]